jgi:hypothetical protein
MSSAMGLRMMFPEQTNRKERAVGGTKRWFDFRIPRASIKRNLAYVRPAGPRRRKILRSSITGRGAIWPRSFFQDNGELSSDVMPAHRNRDAAG